MATAWTIAQVGMGAAKLFSKTSPSNTGAIQIALLHNISKQLRELQSGIAEIARDIVNVKKLIGGIPEAVVQELGKKSIEGNLIAYDELLGLYATYKGNDKKFLQERRGKIEALLAMVTTNRQLLMGYQNYLNLPFIATALNIEYTLMRMLGESAVAIKPIMTSYAGYFKRLLLDEPGSLRTVIADLRVERIKELARADKSTFAANRISYTFGHGWWNWRAGSLQYRTNFEAITDDTVYELHKMGLLNPDERPVTVLWALDTRVPRHVQGVHAEWPVTPTGWAPITSFPTDGERKVQEDERVKLMKESLDLNFEKIVAAVACYHSGVRGLNFCQQFE